MNMFTELAWTCACVCMHMCLCILVCVRVYAFACEFVRLRYVLMYGNGSVVAQ